LTIDIQTRPEVKRTSPSWWSGEMRREAWRFIKFSLVGLSNALVDFVTVAVLVFIFDPESWPAIVAVNSAGFAVGVVNSFIWQTRFTFQSRRSFFSQAFLVFIAINLGSLVLSNVSVLAFRWVFQEVFGLDNNVAILAAKVPTAGMLAAYGYLAYRRLFLGSFGGSMLKRSFHRVWSSGETGE
jgi:putative flippase GtrA